MTTIERRRRPPAPPAGRSQAAPRRRAPITRPPARPWIPDPILAVAAATLTAAVVTVAGTFVGGDLVGGDAGRIWARIFAGALALAGVFLALIGLGLLGDEEIRRSDHYVVPLIAGMWAGALVAMLLLDGRIGPIVILPLLLLLLSLRPVRGGIGRLFGRGAAGGGR